MRLLIVQPKNGLLNDNMISVAKAWSTQYPVAFWNVDAKPAYHMFNNFKPDIVISNYDTISNRAYLKCLEEFKPKVLPMYTIPISADVITYGKFDIASKELSSVYTSVVSYDESEFIKLFSAMSKLDSKHQFKIFSRFQKRISQYCGELDPNTKPLAMNSCQIYVPTNNLDALNAIVMGKEILNCSDISGNMLSRDFILKNFTSFHACKKIWKNFDVTKLQEFVR
jgi:hypothetical protein